MNLLLGEFAAVAFSWLTTKSHAACPVRLKDYHFAGFSPYRSFEPQILADNHASFGRPIESIGSNLRPMACRFRTVSTDRADESGENGTRTYLPLPARALVTIV
jgi:hypothetical protein